MSGKDKERHGVYGPCKECGGGYEVGVGWHHNVGCPMALLNERQHTHGDFGRNAEISQQLKREIRGRADWLNLHPVHREALDMIALKLSRILSGKADHKDHWDDIAGYAKLASEACVEQDRITDSWAAAALEGGRTGNETR